MSPVTNHRWFPLWILVFLDTLSLFTGIVAAAWIRFPSQLFSQEISLLLNHPGFLIYAVATQWALATTFDLYPPGSWRTRDVLFVRAAALAITFPVALSLGVYLVPAWRFGRGILVLTLLIVLPMQVLVRLFWLALGTRPPERQAVLVGDGPIVAALLDELENLPWPPFRIIDHLNAADLEGEVKSVEGRLARADLVIVATLATSGIMSKIAALNFKGTTVIDAAGAYTELTGRVPVLQVDSGWFIATGDFSNLATTPFHYVQRILDILIAATLLIVTSPILLGAALTIAVTGGFPIGFRQTRLGRFRKPFTLIKLRTMKNGAEPDGPAFAEQHDSRFLPGASWLRRWRIDELPQLINVLRGEMSLVGPRPERPEITTRLEREIPFFGFRYSVRPGLTGWAQVHHPYCTDIDDHRVKLEFDLYSLRHYGPALYALVLIRTFGALIFKPGQ